MFSKKVTFLVGHFGSGKTEITLNAAMQLAAQGRRATVVDLDVVKPYFRSRSAVNILAEAGVELVSPLGEFFSSDLPIVLPAVRGKLERPDGAVLFDVGGDDKGVRVVGSLRDSIPPKDTDFLLVVNFKRPFTPDPDSAVAMARAIQTVARFALTGILSNTHLMAETTPELVAGGLEMARETGETLGLPVLGAVADASLKEGLEPMALGCPVLYLNRMILPPHEFPLATRRVGPIFKLG
jgi:hypothetical protein